MTAKKDGGYAFPLAVTYDCEKHTFGMTLRDWFAGQALAVDVAQSGLCITDDGAHAVAERLANFVHHAPGTPIDGTPAGREEAMNGDDTRGKS